MPVRAIDRALPHSTSTSGRRVPDHNESGLANEPGPVRSTSTKHGKGAKTSEDAARRALEVELEGQTAAAQSGEQNAPNSGKGYNRVND